MPSIRKRNNKYQVQVRIQGQQISKTFAQHKDAKKWGMFYENKINLGVDLELLDKNLTLKYLINRYLLEITPTMKGFIQERVRLLRLLKEPITGNKVYLLKTKDFVKFKGVRIKDGNRTCAYDLVLLHHIYSTAIKQWCYPITHNPLSNIQKPKCNPPRERRLNDNEAKYILNHIICFSLKIFSSTFCCSN